VKAQKRQADAEIGWEQFANAEGSQLINDLTKILNTIRRMTRLNRAFYERGQYGQAGSEEAEAVRQEIADCVYTAKEALIQLLGGWEKVEEWHRSHPTSSPS